jgi:hypothetical protein
MELPMTSAEKLSVEFKNSPVKVKFVWACLLLAVLVGCNTDQNPQELREKTARETAAMKRDAKAVAQGIREGWSRDKPLDLNTASKEDLMTLPGVTSEEADRVLAARPFRSPNEMVSRRIMTKTQYDKIADRVVAK